MAELLADCVASRVSEVLRVRVAANVVVAVRSFDAEGVRECDRTCVRDAESGHEIVRLREGDGEGVASAVNDDERDGTNVSLRLKLQLTLRLKLQLTLRLKLQLTLPVGSSRHT